MKQKSITNRLAFFDIIILSSFLLYFQPIECFLYPEFSVQMGNGSVYWDVERMSFVFFDVTKPSSLFRWETVRSVEMWNGSVLSFSM